LTDILLIDNRYPKNEQYICLTGFWEGPEKKAINRMTVTGLVDGLERGFKG
jgi:hypothetical protein